LIFIPTGSLRQHNILSPIAEFDISVKGLIQNDLLYLFTILSLGVDIFYPYLEVFSAKPILYNVLIDCDLPRLGISGLILPLPNFAA